MYTGQVALRRLIYAFGKVFKADCIPGVDPFFESQPSNAAPHSRLINRPGVTRHGHLYRAEVPHHGSGVGKDIFK